MNESNFNIFKDNKIFITEVDNEMENVLFKVIDKINNDYIIIVNDANRYDDYLNSDDKMLFLQISTYQNMIDFYYNKMIGECKEEIKKILTNDKEDIL